MRSFIFRTLGGLAAASLALGVGAHPAAAAGTTTFRLAAGGAVAHGTYAHMMSQPERPVPPFRITGTLIGRSLGRCAVVQVASSGPADGIEWQTAARRCGPGRTSFQAQASYLFRGVQPPVRLCSGWSVAQAVRGRHCDQYQPPTDR